MAQVENQISPPERTIIKEQRPPASPRGEQRSGEFRHHLNALSRGEGTPQDAGPLEPPSTTQTAPAVSEGPSQSAPPHDTNQNAIESILAALENAPPGASKPGTHIRTVSDPLAFPLPEVPASSLDGTGTPELPDLAGTALLQEIGAGTTQPAPAQEELPAQIGHTSPFEITQQPGDDGPALAALQTTDSFAEPEVPGAIAASQAPASQLRGVISAPAGADLTAAEAAGSYAVDADAAAEPDQQTAAPTPETPGQPSAEALPAAAQSAPPEIPSSNAAPVRGVPETAATPQPAPIRPAGPVPTAELSSSSGTPQLAGGTDPGADFLAEDGPTRTGAKPQAAAQGDTPARASASAAPNAGLSGISGAATPTLPLESAAMPGALPVEGAAPPAPNAPSDNSVLIRLGQSTTPGQSQLPAHTIAFQIARSFSNGVNRFEIRIDPPELGRIDVRLDMSVDGRAQAHLTVERAETLDLMQRDARVLERALADAGLDLDRDGLNFSLKDQGDPDGFSDGSGVDADATEQPDANDDQSDPFDQPGTLRGIITDTAVDISV